MISFSLRQKSEGTEHAVENERMPRRFSVPVSLAVVERLREPGIPPKACGQITWCCRVWAAWVKDRKSLPEADLEEPDRKLSDGIAMMSIESFWLPKFRLELRRADQPGVAKRLNTRGHFYKA